VKYRSVKPLKGLAFAFLTLIFALSGASAQDQLIKVTKGKSKFVTYHEKIKAVSLADQEVADVVSITPSALVIIGKAEGATSLIVWGESGELSSYEIEVGRNTSGQQVILEVQVAEVNTTALSEYGLDFLILDTDDDHLGTGTKVLGSYAGAVTSPDPSSEKLFAQDGITGVARFLGNETEISAIVKAMQRHGDLELLANPRLLCLSGEEASFLVGGEIPVPVAQSVGAGGVPSVTIQWKEYGIRLNFIPTVVDTTLINLRITPEVSSLDYTNSVSYAGYDIPALRTRKADAILEINSGQSVLMGGLLSRESFETIKRVPLLGHIPLLSFFFSQKETSQTETELVIIVSPRIITSIADEPVPSLPFDKEPQSVAPAEDQTERGTQSDAKKLDQAETQPADSTAQPAENKIE
jgi:pilus assembly protein CpaC